MTWQASALTANRTCFGMQSRLFDSMLRGLHIWKRRYVSANLATARLAAAQHVLARMFRSRLPEAVSRWAFAARRLNMLGQAEGAAWPGQLSRFCGGLRARWMSWRARWGVVRARIALVTAVCELCTEKGLAYALERCASMSATSLSFENRYLVDVIQLALSRWRRRCRRTRNLEPSGRILRSMLRGTEEAPATATVLTAVGPMPLSGVNRLGCVR